MTRRLLLIEGALKRGVAPLIVASLGCTAAEHPKAIRDAAPAASPAAPPPAAPAPTSAADTKPASPPAPPSVSIPFAQVVENEPIHSVAFGDKRMAALGPKAAWIEEGAGWKKLPDPPADTSGSRIFFGRDDRPRIMGSAGGEYVYLRFRNGAWKRGDEEIAGLASAPRAPLYGVLGHADPEVVCKVGGGCILKRRSGWTLFEPPALQAAPAVELCGAQPYAFEGSRVWKVGNDGFVIIEAKPSFARADALWAVAGDDIWVVERERRSVHHFDGQRWSGASAAIEGPRAVWASGPRDVWIAGDGGAAHFDGSGWSRVEGLPGRLATVFGRSASDVWVGGEPGLFRLREPKR